MTTYNNYARPHPQGNKMDPDRYKRNGSNILKLFAAGPSLVALLSFFLVLGGLWCLSVFDVVAGKTTIEYMSNSPGFAWLTTGGTTGLLLALIGAALYTYRERWSIKVWGPLFLAAAIPSIIDMYFDSLAADIVRFGHLVIINDLPAAEKLPHICFRVLVGGLSAVGDPMAAMSVIVFPFLRELFKGFVGGTND